jgi:hypothetical protein
MSVDDQTIYSLNGGDSRLKALHEYVSSMGLGLVRAQRTGLYSGLVACSLGLRVIIRLAVWQARAK